LPPVLHAVLFFFFFFQAEDGIRDFHVTGVQTCALPICRGVTLATAPYALEAEPRHQARHRALGSADPFTMQLAPDFAHAIHLQRSEERRVGKEWRSRWSPDQ